MFSVLSLEWVSIWFCMLRPLTDSSCSNSGFPNSLNFISSILFTYTVTYGMGGVYSSDFYFWLDCYTDLCGWLALNVQNGLAVEKTKDFLAVLNHHQDLNHSSRSILNETPDHGQAQSHQVLLKKLWHFRRYHPDETQTPGHMTRWFFKL